MSVTVIELVVDQLSKPLPANTTVEVYNLKGILLASITSDVVLPFVMRTYAVYGARFVLKSLSHKYRLRHGRVYLFYIY